MAHVTVLDFAELLDTTDVVKGCERMLEQAVIERSRRGTSFTVWLLRRSHSQSRAGGEENVLILRLVFWVLVDDPCWPNPTGRGALRRLHRHLDAHGAPDWTHAALDVARSRWRAEMWG